MLANKLEGAGAATAPAYIEDVFSTYLYTGTGSTQTITNNIDLSGKGGLVWIKSRSGAVPTANHILQDTARGANKQIRTNTTGAETSDALNWTFSSSGFSMNTSTSYLNDSGTNYASWTFRKQAKFFDVVTYTGNGTAGRTVSHNLGSTPGCIIIKRTDTTADWRVYHRSMDASAPQNYVMYLNLTNASASTGTTWNNTAPTSSVFTLGDATGVNANNGTYVAYLFAHDAGGFGLSGDQSVIKCGSFTGAATNVDVDLGWEPQWVLIKRTNTTDNWRMYDNMRGMTASNGGQMFYADTSGAEVANSRIKAYATGFGFTDDGANTNIYIAIRRGPMKTPTSGTSVFALNSAAGTDPTAKQVTTNFPVDFVLNRGANQSGGNWGALSRLTGPKQYLLTTSTAAEATLTGTYVFDSNTTFSSPTAEFNNTSYTYIRYAMQRAPGFFDVVCYTGTGSARTLSHNLGVVPELMIVKARTTATGNNNWVIYASARGATEGAYFTNAAFQATSSFWNDTTPTSSVFSLGTGNAVNESTITYVAYLFASVNGVSKVGSYTGNGSNQTINCGFTAGARFILIKRTDDTGDWYVYDSARGIVSGNDPQLKLNSTAAEATGYDAIDPDNSGFIVNNDATNFPINVNNATYIYLAIA